MNPKDFKALTAKQAGVLADINLGYPKGRSVAEHLGRAVVRECFANPELRTVAHCYITLGSINRNARVRVIHDGAVVCPSPDRRGGLDSLLRFQEEVAEVREGWECDMTVSGYDDIGVGDIIEAFRLEGDEAA